MKWSTKCPNRSPRAARSRGDRSRRAARLGRRGERVARAYLRRRGLRVLSRNLRSGRGELDIVALEGETLVFVEVKSRTPGTWCDGIERIDRAKERALQSACKSYLAALDDPPETYRLDVVCVEFREGWFRPRVAEIQWYPNVVDLEGW